MGQSLMGQSRVVDSPCGGCHLWVPPHRDIPSNGNQRMSKKLQICQSEVMVHGRIRRGTPSRAMLQRLCDARDRTRIMNQMRPSTIKIWCAPWVQLGHRHKHAFAHIQQTQINLTRNVSTMFSRARLSLPKLKCSKHLPSEAWPRTSPCKRKWFPH